MHIIHGLGRVVAAAGPPRADYAGAAPISKAESGGATPAPKSWVIGRRP